MPAVPSDPLTLAEVDRRVRRYWSLERRRFEVLGGWVASTEELEVKQVLDRHARHHAWHASLWEGHLAHRSGYQAPQQETGEAGLGACLSVLAGVGGPGATAERMAGAYRVVAARAVASYDRLCARASAVSEPALARTCRLVLADQLVDWREGEALVQSLLDSDEAVERAAARQAELEKLVLAR